MSSPIPPRLSDQILPLMRDRFRRCRLDSGLGQALTDRAMADFPGVPGWEELLAPLLARIRAVRPRAGHVIVVPSRDIWSVVDEERLALVLPPEQTIRLYVGRPGRMEPSSRYPTFEVGPCLPLLLGLLRELAPASLYFRGSAQFQSQHLGAALKHLLPGLFLTFEVYDYMSMFDDETPASWNYTPGSVAANRDAETFLGLRADFIVDKTPGAEWEEAARELLVPPRQAYYPALGAGREDPAPPVPRSAPPFRLLCAGSLPYFKNYVPGQGYPEWAFQDVIEPIRILAAAGDFRVDVFNASHDPQLDHWPAFGGYGPFLDPGARGRVGYHPRLGLPELMARIPSYDFGMFLFAASTVPIDYPLQQSLPNRCMSYLAGGLPLIVNREMRCMAGLVERFDAGIALAGTEVEDLPGRIRGADLGAMRLGVRALRRHLMDCNDGALRALSAALGSVPERP